jgi:hypothetical protein
MRRPLVTSTFALALALAPAALFAQTPPPAQPPAQQPPAQPPAAAAPAQPPAPAAPKLDFSTDAGILLIQIKPDQTAAFEELVSKIKERVGKSSDAALKEQIASWKAYKVSEPGANGAVLYSIVIDPAKKATEYDLFGILQKTMTPDELRTEEIQAMFKKFVAAFATGYNKLSLTPLK